MRLTNRIGERYGRLLVIERSPNKSATDTNARWECLCDCGKRTVAYGQDLQRERQVSCGCWNDEKRRKHGLSHTRLNMVWRMMRQRCNNPNDKSYHNYGGRGIAVDPSWSDFAVFLADMGLPPLGGTLDRIDNDGPYSKANCQWATMKRQQNNKRNNHYITFKGETMTMSEWADRLGLSMGAIRNRLLRGWSMERALTNPRVIAYPTFKEPVL